MTQRPVKNKDCPSCGGDLRYSEESSRFCCSACSGKFDLPGSAGVPQTIFLSYAHRSEDEDDFDVSEELVLLIKKELERDGHDVWLDRERIKPGSQWRERITAAILDHTHFMSFLSIRSVRDPGVCLNEIATALASSRHIQTVLAEDERLVVPPLTISHIQWHDFQKWRQIRSGDIQGADGDNWELWFAKRMSEIRIAVRDAGNTRVSGELEKLRDILDPRSFESRIAAKTASFRGREWLFEAAHEWLNGSMRRILWLKGSPGIGKSAFAARLAHKARSAVVGFFMCEYQGRKDPEDSAREVICTLAFQIASRLPDYRLRLLYQYRVTREKIKRRTADELFEYLITEPLSGPGKIPESTRLCLVIDGLDEAGRSDGRNTLAELLYKHAQDLPSWLGLIITSRPDVYLSPLLQGLDAVTVQIDGENNEQDLRAWIDEALPKDMAERPRIMESLLRKAEGSFLYLTLLRNDEKLQRPEQLPNGLDGVFLSNFRRYIPDLQHYAASVEPVLRLIAAAPGLLPLTALEAVLQRSQNDIRRDVLQPMGSYLVEREGGWAFFHAALSDWLSDPTRSFVYAISARGKTELGEWLWLALDHAPDGPFGSLIATWLPQLAPFTSKWTAPTALMRLADYCEQRGRYVAVRSIRLRTLEFYRATVSDHFSLECADALDCLARNFTESAVGQDGRPHYEFAIESLEEAHRIRREKLGEAHELTIWTLARIPYGEAGRYDSGREALEVATQHSHLLTPSQRASVLSAYAYYLYENGHFEKAHGIYWQLVNDETLSKRACCVAWSLLGFIEYELGRWQAALDACATARELLYQSLAEKDHSHLLNTIDLNAALALSRLGQNREAMGVVDRAAVGQEAISFVDRAVAGEAATIPDDSPWLSAILTDQALVHLRAGSLDRARALVDRAASIAFDLQAIHFEPTVPWMLQSWFDFLDGDRFAATERLIRAVHVRHDTLPVGHWRTRIAEENLAYALRAEGRLIEADALALSWGPSVMDVSLPEPHYASLRQLLRLSAAHSRAGQLSQARAAINCAIDLVCRLDETRLPERTELSLALEAFARRLEVVTRDRQK